MGGRVGPRSSRTVWAGGGVLWRPSGSGVEVALVHRPRYDDWSLPKGKSEPGEILPVTAAREIVEETGLAIRLGHHLRTVRYRLPSGACKKVGYWSARVVDGRFRPNRECDELRWMPVDEAIAATSYALDAEVLHEFASRPVSELHTLLVVRHGWAGSRWPGADDVSRPLDEVGRRQADALAQILGLFGAGRLHAADRTRCVQTLEPLAERLDVAIRPEPALSEEAFDADPDAAHARLRKIGAKTGSVHVVCSQGGVIPPILERWADDDAVLLPAARTEKGSVWVLSVRDGVLVTADHIADPLG
ncbi:NUDIX hydrolase [Gordonia shandongensis]|uniref:NUDIX hydrolase n=1 Tax=Gordonia shandongensis TaxID=376351 RepID=UPI00040CE0B6|nr:bifunctional NUDIX hydrolase/histidine phosphatase family protein [Gordonia shandongensis]